MDSSLTHAYTLTARFPPSAAARFSGYPEIDVEALPPARVLKASEIAALVCPKDPQNCEGIVATFETERYEILIRDSLDLDDAADNSFLLHELGHVLHWKARGDAIFEDCSEALRTEAEAYRAQNAYLKREGQFLRFVEMLMFTTCAAETDTLFPRDILIEPNAGK
ncbi:MAG: hypothetical protein ACREV9_07755 [Burkholderiales bacterium]